VASAPEVGVLSRFGLVRLVPLVLFTSLITSSSSLDQLAIDLFSLFKIMLLLINCIFRVSVNDTTVHLSLQGLECRIGRAQLPVIVLDKIMCRTQKKKKKSNVQFYQIYLPTMFGVQNPRCMQSSSWPKDVRQGQASPFPQSDPDFPYPFTVQALRWHTEAMGG
jgi:hypothetical protein